MVKHFGDLVLEKRTRAAYHEAGHYFVARVASPGISVTATIDNLGHGDNWAEFPEETPREVRLLVAVAGFLAEAKGMAEADLSNEPFNTRIMAVEINRFLRAGERAFQVDVFLAAGGNQPAATNQKDFAFLLADLGSRMRNFKAFFGADSWANEIRNAILQCELRLHQAATWAAVEVAKGQLLEHGWISTDR
jgi:hypothetical protein